MYRKNPGSIPLFSILFIAHPSVNSCVPIVRTTQKEFLRSEKDALDSYETASI
jgi:hypothetical protein